MNLNSLALPVALVAVLGAVHAEKATEQRDNRRVYRLDQSGTSLDERWRQALVDAGRQGFGDFWIAYSFMTPHAGDMMISDSRDGGVVFSNGRVITQGPPLAELINPSAVPLEGGNVVVLLHYRGTRTDAVDRAGYRTAQLGFDFGRTPVFWLGDAPEAQSFARVESLFGSARDRKIQTLLIELASLHPDSNAVIPFLTRLVDRGWPAEIRREAAEGFGHQHDPRSVEVLLRVARTDTDSSVRVEAAETIGEVQTPQSIPALMDLVTESPDHDVRREAAEGFGDQPADRALPAIKKVIELVDEEDVLNEAIEAIGELRDQASLPLLVQIANTDRSVQAEAIDALDQFPNDRALRILRDIVARHPDTRIRREAEEHLRERQ